MTFFNACSGVLTVLLVALLGYFLAQKGRVSPEVTTALPKFITIIVLPPYLLRSVTTSFERGDQIMGIIHGAVVPFLSIFIAFAISCALVWILKIPRERRGIFRTAFSTSNSMNIGLPMNIALFGEAALPYALLYFFANSTFFWTAGNYSIARSGEGIPAKLFSLNTLKQICSPPMLGFACGIALVFLNIHLPLFLDKALKYVGDMTLGLALLYIGIIVNQARISEYHLDKDMLWILIGRFMISPLIIIALTAVIPVPAMMRNVFIVQSSLPVMMNAVILAAHYKADLRYAAAAVSISTILSVLTIPAYMLIIIYFL